MAASLRNPRAPPDLAQQLLAYIHFVNSLAEKGYDWAFYDSMFRKEEGKKRYDVYDDGLRTEARERVMAPPPTAALRRLPSAAASVPPRFPSAAAGAPPPFPAAVNHAQPQLQLPSLTRNSESPKKGVSMEEAKKKFPSLSVYDIKGGFCFAWLAGQACPFDSCRLRHFCPFGCVEPFDQHIAAECPRPKYLQSCAMQAAATAPWNSNKNA